jgi:hypothetical protein
VAQMILPQTSKWRYGCPSPARVFLDLDELGDGRFLVPPPGSTTVWELQRNYKVMPWSGSREARRLLAEDVAERDRRYLDDLSVVIATCRHLDLDLLGFAPSFVNSCREYDDADSTIRVRRVGQTRNWLASFGSSPLERRAGHYILGRFNDWHKRPAPRVAACHTWPILEAHRPKFGAGEAEQLDALWRWQQGRCGLCGERATELDHDHETGLVRGWLCRDCNMIIAHKAWILGSTYYDYVRHPPAVFLGIERQWRPIGSRSFRIPASEAA